MNTYFVEHLWADVFEKQIRRLWTCNVNKILNEVDAVFKSIICHAIFMTCPYNIQFPVDLPNEFMYTFAIHKSRL